MTILPSKKKKKSEYATTLIEKNKEVGVEDKWEIDLHDIKATKEK